MKRWLPNVLIILGVGLMAISLTDTTSYGPRTRGRAVSRQWTPFQAGTALGAMMVVGGLLWKRER